MFDPTLNDIREEIAEERDTAAETARLDRKVALLKQLAAASDRLDKEIDDLKTRRDTLKGARKAIKAIADDDDISVEALTDLLDQVNSARGIVTVGVVLSDPFGNAPRMPTPSFHDGGLIRSR